MAARPLPKLPPQPRLSPTMTSHRAPSQPPLRHPHHRYVTISPWGAGPGEDAGRRSPTAPPPPPPPSPRSVPEPAGAAAARSPPRRQVGPPVWGAVVRAREEEVPEGRGVVGVAAAGLGAAAVRGAAGGGGRTGFFSPKSLSEEHDAIRHRHGYCSFATPAPPASRWGSGSFSLRAVWGERKKKKKKRN